MKDVRTSGVSPLVAFVLLTFLLGGALFVLYFLFGGSWQDPSSSLLRLAYGWTPFLSAMLLRRRYTFPKDGYLSVRCFLSAWMLPALLLFATIALAIALPQFELSTSANDIVQRFAPSLPPRSLHVIQTQFFQYAFHPFWIGFAEATLIGGTLYALFYAGEEMGWRGFLFHALSGQNFWVTAFVTGLIWGCWLLPLALVGVPSLSMLLWGIALTFAWALAASPLLHYMRLCGHSVAAIAVFRGTFEALLPLPLLVVSSMNLQIIGGKGIIGIAVLLLADFAIFLRLHRSQSTPQPLAITITKPARTNRRAR